MTDLSAIAHDARVGAYKVLSQLGCGGMGEVWMAEHAVLGRRAAIKLLRRDLSNDQEMVSRFFNEARAAAAITDPGIVQIFDFGNHDGRAFIVMELLDGEALDKRLERVGPFPIPDALRTIRQVASSLGAAHARNIIHRDLKPENIFLVRDPEVPGGERAKILDFGIVKLGVGFGAKLTKTQNVIGTPLYMSPEQCRGTNTIDARTDVYSLGCVLYELVVGEPPFDSEAVGDLLLKHLDAPVPRASSRLRALPPAVDDLISRCLAKDASARFANGNELAHVIGELLETMPAPQSRTQRLSPHARRTPTPARGNRTRAPSRRRAIAGVGTLAICVVGFALLALRSSPATPRGALVVAPAPTPVPPPPPAPPPLFPGEPVRSDVGSHPEPRTPVRKPPRARPPAPHGKSFAGTTLGSDGIPTSR